jgi:FtsH-binding integral membrane protein
MDPVLAQAMLFLVLMFEPPGPLEDGSLKSISDGIREHNGVALAAIACIALVLGRIMRATAWPAVGLVWTALAGQMGVVLHANTEGDGRAHYLFAAVTFTSILILHSLLACDRGACVAVPTALGWAAFAATACANAQGRHDLTGAFEIALVACLWSVWVQLE